MDDCMLSGSQIFMLITGSIASTMACGALVLQFVLKSRCKKINCCGMQCEREVIDLSVADTELMRNNNVQQV